VEVKFENIPVHYLASQIGNTKQIAFKLDLYVLSMNYLGLDYVKTLEIDVKKKDFYDRNVSYHEDDLNLDKHQTFMG